MVVNAGERLTTKINSGKLRFVDKGENEAAHADDISWIAYKRFQ
jgi:hypothetical protein